MTPVGLVTDSTAYLPPELVEKYNIMIVPLYVRFGEEVFRDGVDMTPIQFYSRLPGSPVMPATSQPSPADFVAAYSRLAEEGASEIISIHISSKLSGTIPSALLAQEQLPNLSVHVIDSESTSLGQGFLVLEAARMLEAGQPVAEIVSKLELLRGQVRLLFVVDTLEFLRKGGRIGGAQAFLGSMLNLKPLLAVKEGAVEAVERVRTKRRAVRRMLDMLTGEFVGQPVRAAIIHASVPKEAELLRQQVQASLDCREALVTEMSPVIGTHAGPGTIGIVVCPILEG